MMAFTTIAFTNCSKDKDDGPGGTASDFVGTWYLASEVGWYKVDGIKENINETYTATNSPTTIVLKSDGTYTSFGEDTDNGTWHYSNGKLTTNAGDDESSANVLELSSEKFTLELSQNEDGYEVYLKATYKKK